MKNCNLIFAKKFLLSFCLTLLSVHSFAQNAVMNNSTNQTQAPRQPDNEFTPATLPTGACIETVTEETYQDCHIHTCTERTRTVVTCDGTCDPHYNTVIDNGVEKKCRACYGQNPDCPCCDSPITSNAASFGIVIGSIFGAFVIGTCSAVAIVTVACVSGLWCRTNRKIANLPQHDPFEVEFQGLALQSVSPFAGNAVHIPSGRCGPLASGYSSQPHSSAYGESQPPQSPYGH